MSLKARLIEIAQSFVGTKEATGNNDGEQVEAFQKAVDGKAQGEPWCMAFVQFCVQHVDYENQIDYHRDYLVDTEHCLTAWNKSPEEARSFTPAPGKIIIWAKDDQSGKGHTGIVVSINEDGTLNTIEGNTSSGTGDPRDGDGVYNRRRPADRMGSLVVLGYLDPWPWE